jgi:hypothetical protein
VAQRADAEEAAAAAFLRGQHLDVEVGAARDVKEQRPERREVRTGAAHVEGRIAKRHAATFERPLGSQAPREEGRVLALGERRPDGPGDLRGRPRREGALGEAAPRAGHSPGAGEEGEGCEEDGGRGAHAR